MSIYRFCGALLVAAITLAGCATPPRNAALEDARIEVARARADAAVATAAPEQLAAAEDALARAEGTWQQWGSAAEVSRFADLARDRAALAQDIARQRAATARLEAEEARRSAALAQAQAAQAQQLAEEARARAASAAAAAAAAAQAGQARPLMDPRARLDADLRALAMQPTPGATVVTLDESLFEPRASALRPDAAYSLDTLARFLREQPQRFVVVEAFSGDLRGNAPDYALAERRALAVRDALVARGIAGRRVEVRPFAAPRALRPGATALGERVEIVISDSSGRLPR